MRTEPNRGIPMLLLFVLVSLPFFTGTGASYAGGTHRVRLIRADIIKSEKLFTPTNVFVDRVTGEIYVGRANRLFIFNEEGFLLSTINLGKNFSARGALVDSKGTIYVRNSNTRTISKFDQLGKRLGLLRVKKEGREELSVVSMDIDSNDNLYLLDGASGSCLVTDVEGKIKRVIGEGELKTFNDMAVSSDGKTLAFISFSKGKIRLYENGGAMIAEFGKQGGGSGSFSQPMAVALAPDGRVFALDRNRQALLIFDRDGLYNGEFGGMGDGAGLFYYPNDIYVDDEYNIFVADTQNKRLQRLRVELIKN